MTVDRVKISALYLEQDARKFPDLEKAAHLTSFSCPSRVAEHSNWPDFRSHTATVPSKEAVTEQGMTNWTFITDQLTFVSRPKKYTRNPSYQTICNFSNFSFKTIASVWLFMVIPVARKFPHGDHSTDLTVRVWASVRIVTHDQTPLSSLLQSLWGFWDRHDHYRGDLCTWYRICSSLSNILGKVEGRWLALKGTISAAQKPFYGPRRGSWWRMEREYVVFPREGLWGNYFLFILPLEYLTVGALPGSVDRTRMS